MRPKRGYPTRELCLERLEFYDRLIMAKGTTAYLQEQRDWWARQLANVNRVLEDLTVRDFHPE